MIAIISDNRYAKKESGLNLTFQDLGLKNGH